MWRPSLGWPFQGQAGKPAPQAAPSSAVNANGSKAIQTKSAANRSTQATRTSAVNGPSTVPTGAPSVGAQPGGMPTTVGAQPAGYSDFDYWIVSSRNCGAMQPTGDPARCLVYLHRTSEQNLIRERPEAFLAAIDPHRPVCFVMHGSYNRWGDILQESRKINRWLRSAAPNSPLQVVFFTWPSDGNMPFIFPVDIAILGRRSAAHGAYLASLISQLPAEQQVAIVGHSHGARTAAAALHLMGGGTLEEGPVLPAGSSYPRQVRVVMMAAALDHTWLNPGQRYGQALLVPERVLLLRNSRDFTLALYPMRKVIGERALGKDGLGQDDRLALGSLGSKVVELNAAEFANWHHSFADYHEHPELGAAMSPYVYFQDDAASQSGEPARPTMGASNRASPGSSTSPLRIAPPVRPPAARLGSDASSAKQRAGDERLDEQAEPGLPRIELRIED